MNPETGEFHVIDSVGKIEVEQVKVPVPESWPCFAVGDAVQVNGWPFEISRINRGSIVLRPITVDSDKMTSPRRLMDGYMYEPRR